MATPRRPLCLHNAVDESPPAVVRVLWEVGGILVIVLAIAAMLASCAPRDQYPLAPSNWDGASAALSVPTPAPSPFPSSFEGFVAMARQNDLLKEKRCDDLYLYCEFTGPGLTMSVAGNDDDGSINDIVFRLDRYQMADAARTFNQVVWNTHLEEQGEAARRLVDGVESDTYKEVDGINVTVTFEYVTPPTREYLLVRFFD